MKSNLSTEERKSIHREFISNPLHSYIIFDHFNEIIDLVINEMTREKSRMDVIGQNGNDGLHYEE